MYGPPSRGGAGAGAAGEQPRVYQVWRGSNVSSRSLCFSSSCFWILCACEQSVWIWAYGDYQEFCEKTVGSLTRFCTSGGKT